MISVIDDVYGIELRHRFSLLSNLINTLNNCPVNPGLDQLFGHESARNVLLITKQLRYLSAQFRTQKKQNFFTYPDRQFMKNISYVIGGELIEQWTQLVGPVHTQIGPALLGCQVTDDLRLLIERKQIHYKLGLRRVEFIQKS